jgi:hypothetical protein
VPSGEKIPVGNDKNGIDHVEGYLIENNAINGASGSPVFVRGSTELTMGEKRLHVMLNKTDIFLFGIYQAAWFLPPDAVLKEGVQAGAKDVVPVGIGVVVPVAKLGGIARNSRTQRNARKKSESRNYSRDARWLFPREEESSPPANDANPAHQEDFMRLVGEAARKREQED